MLRNRLTTTDRPTPTQRRWLALLLGAAYLPLTAHLSWRISAFVLALTALRLLGQRWPRAIPTSWPLLLLTLAGLANCLLTYRTLAGQQGGTALFVTMLALKLMELRTRRDLRLTAILLGFLIVAHLLFEQSPLLAVYLAAIVLATLALLTDLNGTLAEPAGPGRRLPPALTTAVRLSLQALPLTLVLFVLFPRLNAPLWSLGPQPELARTGLADRMEPGAVSELALSGELAFRVRFETPPPPSTQLYWRGLVLWDMDGRRWTGDPPPERAAPAASSPPSPAPPPLAAADTRLAYEILLEPSDRHWLFTLELPVALPGEGRMSPDFAWRAAAPVRTAHRYRAVSALVYRTAEPDAAARARGLRLPDTVTPRMRALAAGWRAAAADDRAVIDAALRFLNREAFHYTLLPPRLGDNPTDEFLFETRRGFCEHYASAFALLMRIAGIPARVVLGYLGGDLNPLGGHHLIWQSDAHAWVEVALAGQGWVRVDPTAAVDPSRIDNQGAARLLGAAPPVRFTVGNPALLDRLLRNWRLAGDTLDAAWQNWILDFSAARQRALLERIGLGDWREYGLALLMFAGIALTLGLLLLSLLRDPRPRDPLARQYARFCRRLARAGLPRRPDEGPRDFGARVRGQRPELAPRVAAFLAIYVAARFGPRPDPRAGRQLADCLRGFHPRVN